MRVELRYTDEMVTSDSSVIVKNNWVNLESALADLGVKLDFYTYTGDSDAEYIEIVIVDEEAVNKPIHLVDAVSDTFILCDNSDRELFITFGNLVMKAMKVSNRYHEECYVNIRILNGLYERVTIDEFIERYPALYLTEDEFDSVTKDIGKHAEVLSKMALTIEQEQALSSLARDLASIDINSNVNSVKVKLNALNLATAIVKSGIQI